MDTRLRGPWLAAFAALSLLAAFPAPALAHGDGSCGDDDDDDDRPEWRERARQRIHHRRHGFRRGRHDVHVQLLGFNDFHGQLSAGKLVAGRPVGSAPVLTAYLHQEQDEFDGETFLVHAGDHVGASPPASALLQDEPSITFLNMLAGRACRRGGWWNDDCNVVGTLGNHEFDDGVDEMLRLIGGGRHPNGPFLDRRWEGATFPYVSSNVVDADSGEHILPPSVVRRVRGIPIGFIGAVLQETPTIVTPAGVAGVEFLDEAESINRQVRFLRRRGVETFVVLIHQGGPQTTYAGETNPAAAGPGGAIAEILHDLDSAVDVVVSGHAHAFTNAFVENAEGHPILVTQAFSAGTAYGDIELTIDPRTHDVVESSAAVITTYADEGPGLTPDLEVAELVASAEEYVAPLVEQFVGTAAQAITRVASPAGESALGNLLADAQRDAMGTDIAFMNPGGIRADIAAGDVTWGELFAVQPFGNSLVRMDLTGDQIVLVLEQQWAGQPFPRIMQVSGLTYTWDALAPVGARIVDVQIEDGTPLDLDATYSVTVNSFMATGGDNFFTFASGVNRVGGPIDLDALVGYIALLAQPFDSVIEGRISLF